MWQEGHVLRHFAFANLGFMSSVSHLPCHHTYMWLRSKLLPLQQFRLIDKVSKMIVWERSLVPMLAHTHTHAWAHAHINVCIRMHSLPVVAYTTAGVALLLPSLLSAHAVILYWASGIAGLIVTVPPVFTFSYCPIIDTPKRITTYPVINASVIPSFLWTW